MKKEEILKEVFNQLKEILNSSDQSIYIYIDDEHKICNEKFASMLNYASAKEWASVKENFPTAFVANKSQPTLIHAFQNAMESAIGSSMEIEWKKKSGDTIKTKVILVPIVYNGQRMALHFISKY